MNEYVAAFVEELYSLGVRDVVISPGSRSTPLSMLFTDFGNGHDGESNEQHRFNTYVNVDERSAAFFALGIAKGYTQLKPVVLVCTSGSAMTHYFPAVIEAQHGRIPLIILSADRPARLQHVGAPQTIDQQKLFGTSVNYYEELAMPLDGQYYTYPRQVAQKAYMHAMGTTVGPVHINVPVEEPLAPDLDEFPYIGGIGPRRFQVRSGVIGLDSSTQELLSSMVEGKKVLILCGPQSGTVDGDAILALGEQLGAPIIGDPLSNMRRFSSPLIMDSYDAFLTDESLTTTLRTDCIIQFGPMVVSKRMQQFISKLYDVEYIQVDPTGAYRNPMGMTTMHVTCDILPFVESLSHINNNDTGFSQLWADKNASSRNLLNSAKTEESFFEGTMIRLLQEHIPRGCQVVTANSMSVRGMDYFWSAGSSDAYIYGNRGTNGIDGTISTALGISTNGKPTVLVTGDLALFHDMTGLGVGKTAGLKLTIIVSNNDGGGIFEYLPQKGVPYFDYLFSTEQGLTYKGLAELYNIDYYKADSSTAFVEAFSKSICNESISLIEVPTNKEVSRMLHKKYIK